MREKKRASFCREKKYFCFYSARGYIDQLGARLSFGIACEMELEQAAFFGIGGIHS